MKKTFLIAGLIAGLTATNGYAVGSQTVVVTYGCPDGCELLTSGTWTDGNGAGHLKVYCECPDGTTPDATVHIKDLAPTPATMQEVMSQSTLNQAAIKNVKKTKTTSARAVTVSPKVIKKVVYEEIISDDYAEELK